MIIIKDLLEKRRKQKCRKLKTSKDKNVERQNRKTTFRLTCYGRW